MATSRSSDDIAIIGWSVSPMVRNTDMTEAQMLLDVVSGAVDDAGITRHEVDFTCAGSCDYMAGQAFSFVQNIDAVGAWPPKRDSHVEMDGAWALYEAWVRLLMGDIDVAVAMGSGRSSTADPALIYPMEMDPYYLAPLGTDPVSFAAIQARALLDAGKVTERQMAEIAARARRDAKANPHAQVAGDFDVDELLASEPVRDPLRRHDLPPVTDGACAMVIARADRARELCENPVWITGFAHCAELHYPGIRDLRTLGVDPPRRQGRRDRRGARRGRRAPGRLHPRGAGARRGPRPRRRRGRQPLRGPAGRQPDHGHRPRAHRRGRRPDPRPRQAPHARALDLRSVPAAEPRLHPGRGRLMAHQPCAIVGVGQTHHKTRRWDVSLGGLVREAATRALEDAQMDWDDIDAVVLGKAPDLFEGVMKPELYLTDALGAHHKPMFRVHTAGSVGGTTGIVASHLVETGRHTRVLAVAFQKQSEGNAQFALGVGPGSLPGCRRRLRAVHALLHPPQRRARWTSARWSR